MLPGAIAGPPLRTPIERKAKTSARAVSGHMADPARRSSAETLERIYLSAREEFSEHGFDGARLDSIGHKAGVTKQLVYHYFKTKEELYAVVLDRVAGEIESLLDDPDYDLLSPPDALRRFVDHMIAALADHPYMVVMTLDQGLHRGQHLSRRSQYLPAINSLVDTRLVPILRRGAEQGVFRSDIEPLLVYWSMFALVTVVFTQSWAISRSTGADFAAPEGIARWRDHAVDQILRGVADVPTLPA
jgi:TetR/AcrR family transcriptional regulator